jgi:hypothetical protein
VNQIKSKAEHITRAALSIWWAGGEWRTCVNLLESLLVAPSATKGGSSSLMANFYGNYALLKAGR